MSIQRKGISNLCAHRMLNITGQIFYNLSNEILSAPFSNRTTTRASEGFNSLLHIKVYSVKSTNGNLQFIRNPDNNFLQKIMGSLKEKEVSGEMPPQCLKQFCF